MNFTLIQRGNFCGSENVSKAVKLFGSEYDDKPGLIDLDYMGRAEFEFGAISASNNFIFTHFDEYELVDTGLRTIRGVPVWLFWRKSDKYFDKIKNAIKEHLIDAEYDSYLLEPAHFYGHFHDNKYRSATCNFLWCIDDTNCGQWMLFIGAADRVNKFKELNGKRIQRFKDDNELYIRVGEVMKSYGIITETPVMAFRRSIGAIINEQINKTETEEYLDRCLLNCIDRAELYTSIAYAIRVHPESTHANNQICRVKVYDDMTNQLSVLSDDEKTKLIQALSGIIKGITSPMIKEKIGVFFSAV